MGILSGLGEVGKASRTFSKIKPYKYKGGVPVYRSSHDTTGEAYLSTLRGNSATRLDQGSNLNLSELRGHLMQHTMPRGQEFRREVHYPDSYTSGEWVREVANPFVARNMPSKIKGNISLRGGDLTPYPVGRPMRTVKDQLKFRRQQLLAAKFGPK